MRLLALEQTTGQIVAPKEKPNDFHRLEAKWNRLLKVNRSVAISDSKYLYPYRLEIEAVFTSVCSYCGNGHLGPILMMEYRGAFKVGQSLPHGSDLRQFVV
jgi:uncharacterized protein (DUF1786 family)